MDQQEYDDLLRRLTALLVKLDERDDDLLARQADHEATISRLDAMITRHDARMDRLEAGIDELKALNREQVAINQRLATLLERAWRSSPNGHTD